MSSMQKSCVLPASGAGIVLQDRPVPTPGPGQVLVKITAAARCDAAGIVEAIGEGVSKFKKGDRVFFQGDFSHDGATFQHYATVMSNLVAKTPLNITDEQASTLPTSLVTSVVLLFNNTAFAPPLNGPTASEAPILILGGSGSVGRACIQMARIAGFSPIITTASSAHTESLKAIGATHVFERTVSAATIHEVLKVDNKPVKLVVDTVSNAGTQLFGLQVLTTQPNAPFGELQLQLVLPPTEELQAQNDALAEGRVKAGIVAGVAYKQPEVFAPFFGVAEKWLEEGLMVPGTVELLKGGLASVQAGLDRLAKGVSGIKLVVNP
ncbi:hypothetical protein FRC10_000915 [Ceratobasidium sp. 414]|nr:hypothetical protein FRC10_000915 [Ceratobasidium sp. 414]